MTTSETKVRQSYSWLPLLVIVMTVVTLAIGGSGLRYIETRMVATAGETLAFTAAEVSDKLDRFLSERHGALLMLGRTISTQPQDREFQSTYVDWMKTSYQDYLWIGH